MSQFRRSAAAYLGTVVLCLTFLVWSLKLWRADLAVPFTYGSDGLHTLLWVKGVCEHGWYLFNPTVGAPFGLEMHDFPLADGLYFALLRGVALVARDPSRTLNLYFLLTFPLTVLSAVFVFRRFGVGRVPAVVAGLWFGFLPAHFLRGEGHLFLASYFVVPLSIAVALRILLGDEGAGDMPPSRGRAGRWAVPVVCVLSGSGGIYYAFFTCYLFLVAGLTAALRGGGWKPLRAAVACVALVTAGVLANVAPNLAYQRRNGPNAEAVVRPLLHVEYFGLKLAPLLLPVRKHRLPPLELLRARYDTAVCEPFNENAFATLGLAGSLGFVALVVGVFGRSRGEGRRLWDALVALNLASVLLATVGGFGMLFGLLLSPWIRAYNRVSVFLAFFTLFAVALGLTRVERLARSRGGCVPRASGSPCFC